MMIMSIMAAPNPKRAVMYDDNTDELVFHLADIIGLIAMDNPDEPDEVAYIPMYMVSDNFGGYNLPQLDIRFIEFINTFDQVNLDQYLPQIEEIKQEISNIQNGTIEVETKGNLTQIKRVTRRPKLEAPKDED